MCVSGNRQGIYADVITASVVEHGTDRVRSFSQMGLYKLPSKECLWIALVIATLRGCPDTDGTVLGCNPDVAHFLAWFCEMVVRR